MLVSSTEYLKRAKWGGTCLESQPLEDKDQRLRVQIQPMLQSEFQVSLDRETLPQNKTTFPFQIPIKVNLQPAASRKCLRIHTEKHNIPGMCNLVMIQSCFENCNCP